MVISKIYSSKSNCYANGASFPLDRHARLIASRNARVDAGLPLLYGKSSVDELPRIKRQRNVPFKIP